VAVCDHQAPFLCQTVGQIISVLTRLMQVVKMAWRIWAHFLSQTWCRYLNSP
jgi:hypothetical protein